LSIASLFVCFLSVTCESQAVTITTEQVVFTIDQAQSTIFGDAFLNPIGQSAGAQDANDVSRNPTYSGTITVGVDNPSNPTSIEFLSASAAATITGDWLPQFGGGSEGDPGVQGDADPGTPQPANYGWFLQDGLLGQFYAAARDVVLSLTAGPIAIASDEFDPFGIIVTVPQGSYSANTSSPILGDIRVLDILDDKVGHNCTDMFGTVNNCTGQDGTYTVAGGVATLTIPLHFILGQGNEVEVILSGMLVATATVPEPSGCVLMLTMFGSALIVARRNRC
jgi:hypothetical protein